MHRDLKPENILMDNGVCKIMILAFRELLQTCIKQSLNVTWQSSYMGSLK